jgi:hypothetical protein
MHRWPRIAYIRDNEQELALLWVNVYCNYEGLTMPRQAYTYC